MIKKKLTDKEKVFIAEYCSNGFNGSKAAITAGYSKKTSRQIATENLTKPHIKEEIKGYIDSILSQYKDTLEYEIIQTYKTLAFYNVEDIIKKDGSLKVTDLKKLGELSKCIKGIQTTFNAKGVKQVKIMLEDRDHALEMLSKYIGILRDNEVTINIFSENVKQKIKEIENNVQ
jgi:phage terminase small subunit